MHSRSQRTLAILVLLAGFALGSLSLGLVPAAQAQTPAPAPAPAEAPAKAREPAQRWEYLVLHPRIEGFGTGKIGPEARAQLARLGREGWELVAVDRVGTDANYVFKRPLP